LPFDSDTKRAVDTNVDWRIITIGLNYLIIAHTILPEMEITFEYFIPVTADSG
jgi:hypothetical protein